MALSDTAPPARAGSVEFRRAGAAADRETLLERGQHGRRPASAMVTDTGTTRPNSVSVAIRKPLR